MTQCDTNHPLEQIRLLYTRLARHPEQDFGWGKGRENARRLGYADEWLGRLPDTVLESAAAVGNPFSLGPIHPGETVVDIGCGAGADACIAAMLVGKEGQVYGIDSTPAMVDKARENAQACGLPQALFLQAEMAELPLPDRVADVVISNGAINLAGDKSAALGEMFRVLRPGGRLQIADMVRNTSARDASCCNPAETWADCVAGTLQPDTLLAMLARAGFSNAELAGFTGYRTADSTTGALLRAFKPG